MSSVQDRNGHRDEFITSPAAGDDIVKELSVLGGKSPNSKGLHPNDRMKHKAIRPSARLNSLGSDGTGSDHGIWKSQSVSSGLKKYTKNSRRPRGRYGRGLPKKGQSLSLEFSRMSRASPSTCVTRIH
jgi:hypothetical protein